MRRSLAKCSAVLVVAVTLSVSACSYFVSWDDKSQMLIGRPVEVYTRVNGPPDGIKELPNGNKEYKYWLKKLDPSCVHYWIVDPQGVITGYHYEGRCRPIG